MLKNEVIERLINVSLRALSMGSRFILLFVLAKLLPPKELGLFGLMLATVSFSVLLIGADYYTYAQRELLARPPELWSFVIQHQLKAQLLLYILLLPTQLVIFIFGLMDWVYVFWFFGLLVLEHIAQEINRILIVMHKQLMASWILFIRMGSWVLVVLPIMFFYSELRGLTTLYFFWMMGCAIAILVGSVSIRKSLPVWRKQKTDYCWLIKGFKVGGVFLIATLCFRGLFTFDKYAVEALTSSDELGVYVFYIGIVMGVYNFLDPAVFSFLYPRMSQSYQKQDKKEYQKTFRELIFSTCIISVFLGLIIWFITPYIIGWVDKPIYSNYIESLNLLIIMGLISAVGYIPHYGLYAMRGDRWIVTAHFTAILVFFSFLSLFHLRNGIETVSFALLMAFSSMAMVKVVGYRVIKRNKMLFTGNF